MKELRIDHTPGFVRMRSYHHKKVIWQLHHCIDDNEVIDNLLAISALYLGFIFMDTCMAKSVDMTFKRADREFLDYTNHQRVHTHWFNHAWECGRADERSLQAQRYQTQPIDQSNTQSHMYRNSDVLKAIKRLFLYTSYITANEEKDCKTSRWLCCYIWW